MRMPLAIKIKKCMHCFKSKSKILKSQLVLEFDFEQFHSLIKVTDGDGLILMC